MPSTALKHLQSLQFVFPNYYSLMPPGSRAAQDWAHLIALLSRSANLPRLSLIIDLSYGRRHPDLDRPDMEKEPLYQDAHRRVVEPLAQLKGLKDLFIHLEWPWGYGNSHEREQALEKWVMGAEYDSLSRGKCNRPDRLAYYVYQAFWGFNSILTANMP